MFTVYGPGITNPIPLEKLFVRPAVVKAAAIAAKQAIKAEMDNGSSPAFVHQSAMGKQKYQAAERVSKRALTEDDHQDTLLARERDSYIPRISSILLFNEPVNPSV